MDIKRVASTNSTADPFGETINYGRTINGSVAISRGKRDPSHFIFPRRQHCIESTHKSKCTKPSPLYFVTSSLFLPFGIDIRVRMQESSSHLRGFTHFITFNFYFFGFNNWITWIKGSWSSWNRISSLNHKNTTNFRIAVLLIIIPLLRFLKSTTSMSQFRK